jgi:hypothetical protein
MFIKSSSLSFLLCCLLLECFSNAEVIKATIVEKDGKEFNVDSLSFEEWRKEIAGYRQSGRQLENIELTIGRIQTEIPFQRIQKIELFEKGSKAKVVLYDGKMLQGELSWWYDGESLEGINFSGRTKVKGFDADFVMPLDKIKELIFRKSGDGKKSIIDVTDTDDKITKDISSLRYSTKGHDPFISSSSKYYVPLKIAEVGTTRVEVSFEKIKKMEISEGLKSIITLLDGNTIEGTILLSSSDKLYAKTRYEGLDSYYVSTFSNVNSIIFHR